MTMINCIQFLDEDMPDDYVLIQFTSLENLKLMLECLPKKLESVPEIAHQMVTANKAKRGEN